MTEIKRIPYTSFGICSICPEGKEYQPKVNLKHFNDIEKIIHTALILINRHQMAVHPNVEIKKSGILLSSISK